MSSTLSIILSILFLHCSICEQTNSSGMLFIYLLQSSGVRRPSERNLYISETDEMNVNHHYSTLISVHTCFIKWVHVCAMWSCDDDDNDDATAAAADNDDDDDDDALCTVTFSAINATTTINVMLKR